MRRPRVCVALTAGTVEEAVQMAQRAERDGADIVELRADYLKELASPRDVIESTSLPMVFTLRKFTEGGLFTGSEDERIGAILKWAGEGFKFVDVELSTPNLSRVVETLREMGLMTIISCHVIDSTPGIEQILNMIKDELRAGADICKVITTAKEIGDNVGCLRAVSLASRWTRVICFAMGELGLISRVLSPLLGGYCTFASMVEGMESAPGQLTIGEARKIYRAFGYE